MVIREMKHSGHAGAHSKDYSKVSEEMNYLKVLGQANIIRQESGGTQTMFVEITLFFYFSFLGNGKCQTV